MSQKVEEEKKNRLALLGNGGGLEAAPSFMDNDGMEGVEDLRKKIRPPFMKIIQKQSSDELIAEHGMGSAILTPDNFKILEDGGSPIRIVPVFYYVEYLKLSPITLKDSEPMIKERSTDPNSELARRCTNRALWSEFHPAHPNDAKFAYRNCESLNFMCLFHEPDVQIDTPFLLAFSRGSFGKGQQFCNLINMRKKPLYSCVFDLSIDPVPGKNSSGTWRRFLIENPKSNPWVSNEEEYRVLQGVHRELVEQFRANNIEAGYDESELNEGEGNTGEY